MKRLSTAPKVSIILPTYNRGYLIARTIRSVLNQTYTNFELLIIDDASNDNTYEVVSSFSDNRIKYICLEQNTKGTMPRNVGIDKSIGEYIAFLDSDDEWLSNKLEEQIKFISKIETENFLCFTGLIKKNEFKERIKKQRDLKENEDIMDYILVGDNEVQTSTYLLPSKLAKKIKFDPNVRKHQDWDFCIRLKKENTSFFYLPKNLTIWHVDSRADRLSKKNDYHYSIEWFNKSKPYLSIKAQNAFLAKIIANHYVEQKNKFQALKIYIKAYMIGAVSLKFLIKKVINLIIP